MLLRLTSYRNICLSTGLIVGSLGCGNGGDGADGTEGESGTEAATDTASTSVTASESQTDTDTESATVSASGDGDGDDDGTATSGDPYCGDSVVDAGEECDDGNDDNTDDCLDTCVSATCGDGFTHAGVEDCDDAELNNDLSGPCRTDCSVCDCQGTNPPPGATCADAGMTCGVLGCDGCGFDTSDCSQFTVPDYDGPTAPEFSNELCWFPCDGYTDTPADGDIPTTWGVGCESTDYTRVRLACGINESVYRYIDVEKNIFTFLLAANPEAGLISASADQDGTPFAVTLNEVWAEGATPFVLTDTSWFGGNANCLEGGANLSVNNELCGWEAAGCFGQNIAGERKLWVYVSQ